MNNMDVAISWKRRLADNLLFLSVGSLFVWSIVCAVLNCVGFGPQYGEILLRAIAVTLALRIVFINKYTAAASVTIILLTVGVTVINLLSDPNLAGSLEKAADFVRGLTRYIMGYEAYEQAYETAVTWALCGAASLFTVVFGKVCFRFFAVFGLAAAVFTAVLSSGVFSYDLSFLACIFSLLVFFVKHLQNSPKKTFNPQAFAIVAVCFCAAYFIPVPKEGFSETVAETVVYKPIKAASKFVGEIFAPKYFSLSTAGYNRKDGRMGGDITLTDDLVLEVAFADRWLDKPLYFAGAVKDKYTGWSWENTVPESEPVYFSDDAPTVEFLEVMFSNIMISLNSGEFEEIVKVLEKPEKLLETWYQSRCEYIPGGTLTLQMEQSVYKLKKAEVTLKGSKTYSIFSLSRTVDVAKGDGEVSLVKDGQDNLTAEVLMTKNSSYTVSYRTDPSDSYWNGINSLSRKGIYEEILKTIQELHERYDFDKNQVSVLLDSSLDEDKSNMHMFKMYPAGEEYFNPEVSMNYEDLLTGVFIPRAREIYERYTMLPDGFPKRVADLANDVVKNAESDYAKAKAISSFLRKYPYTFTPGEVPENRDFVDYFLFDGQTGYCTYYASAFVTMCRAVGLPARYVEGYVTPLKRNDEGYYAVTNKQGHAWGEVYFEGYGWVQFEPTPSAASAGNLSALPTSEQYPYVAEPDRQETVTESVSAVLPSGESYGSERDEESIRGNVAYNFFIAVLILAAAIASVIFIRFLTGRNAERGIAKKSNNEAAGLYFQILLKYLKFFRYEKAPGETVAQYAERLGGEVRFANGSINMDEIAEILSRARYGKEQVSDADMDIIKRALKDIDAEMRRSVGKARYIYYRYAARTV